MDEYDLRNRLDKAEWVLNNTGFRRCDIAACNPPRRNWLMPYDCAGPAVTMFDLASRKPSRRANVS